MTTIAGIATNGEAVSLRGSAASCRACATSGARNATARTATATTDVAMAATTAPGSDAVTGMKAAMEAMISPASTAETSGLSVSGTAIPRAATPTRAARLYSSLYDLKRPPCAGASTSGGCASQSPPTPCCDTLLICLAGSEAIRYDRNHVTGERLWPTAVCALRQA